MKQTNAGVDVGDGVASGALAFLADRNCMTVGVVELEFALARGADVVSEWVGVLAVGIGVSKSHLLEAWSSQ
eukprot:2178545-Pyramimonas_sp.AAC.1